MIKKDYLKAKYFYDLAAKKYDSNAFNKLGKLYFNGYGVKVDIQKAKYYYELSAVIFIH